MHLEFKKDFSVDMHEVRLEALLQGCDANRQRAVAKLTGKFLLLLYPDAMHQIKSSVCLFCYR